MKRTAILIVAMIGMGVALLSGSGVAAKPVDESVQAEFRRVIERQLDAFRRNDGEAAFAQASPEIRALFGNAERFMTMVRTAYETVYRPRAYEFEPAVAFSDRTAQPVKFVGPDGRSALAIYYMEQQADGSWRIGGVELVPLTEREI